MKNKKGIIYALLIFFCAAANLPVLSMIGTALKPRSETLSTVSLFTLHPTLDNFIHVLTRTSFAQSLVNTIFVALIVTELDEAAMIDGCSRFQAYWRIILPFSLPGVASVGVFTLMNVWNEYTIASIFIQDKNLRTLSVGIRQFMMQNTTDWASMSAAATIAVLPAFVMIIFAQKYLVGGLTSGSVKG